MRKWVQLTSGVRIDGMHRDPKEPPFEVDERFARELVNSNKGRIVDPPLTEESPIDDAAEPDVEPVHGWEQDDNPIRQSKGKRKPGK